MLRVRTHPTWLTYPFLPILEGNMKPIKAYMIITLETGNQYVYMSPKFGMLDACKYF